MLLVEMDDFEPSTHRRATEDRHHPPASQLIESDIQSRGDRTGEHVNPLPVRPNQPKWPETHRRGRAQHFQNGNNETNERERELSTTNHQPRPYKPLRTRWRGDRGRTLRKTSQVFILYVFLRLKAVRDVDGKTVAAAISRPPPYRPTLACEFLISSWTKPTRIPRHVVFFRGNERAPPGARWRGVAFRL
jgi:hypothetical protein